MKLDKIYLGDGLYCSHDGYQFHLTAENGIRIQNEIYLDDQVVSRLLAAIETVYKVKIKVERPLNGF
jgi:GTP cyclohydrolase III